MTLECMNLENMNHEKNSAATRIKTINVSKGATVMQTQLRLSRIAQPRATQGAMVLLLTAFVVFSAVASLLG